MSILFKEKQLTDIYAQCENAFGLPPFCDYITALCHERKQVPERIIARADIEKTYGHKLFAGTRNPSRDMVIRLAFGFDADVALAQELLRIARKSALYPRVKRDTALIYCLHNHISVVDTQLVLLELGLPILGEENKNARTLTDR